MGVLLMGALALVGNDDLCVGTKEALPYYVCPCGSRHVFSDPTREGRLLDGWGTLVAVAPREAVPFTHALPGQDPWL